MTHDINYYKSVIRVIDFISDSETHEVSGDKGYELAGNYWPSVVELLKDNHVVSVGSGGTIFITQHHLLGPIYEESHHKCREIEKNEHDRELSNREKEENIKYGKKGYRLAIIALIVSCIAILIEILLALLLR